MASTAVEAKAWSRQHVKIRWLSDDELVIHITHWLRLEDHQFPIHRVELEEFLTRELKPTFNWPYMQPDEFCPDTEAAMTERAAKGKK